jgi:(2Fe-2S) ferredoxin
MSIFQKHVFVCTSGETCAEQGSAAVLESLREEIKERGLKKEIRINKAGCLGQCGHGPMVVVYPQSTWYCQVSSKDAKEIIEKDLIEGKIVKRLLYKP